MVGFTVCRDGWMGKLTFSNFVKPVLRSSPRKLKILKLYVKHVLEAPFFTNCAPTKSEILKLKLLKFYEMTPTLKKVNK